MVVANLQKTPEGVPEISCSQEWDGQIITGDNVYLLKGPLLYPILMSHAMRLI